MQWLPKRSNSCKQPVTPGLIWQIHRKFDSRSADTKKQGKTLLNLTYELPFGQVCQWNRILIFDYNFVSRNWGKTIIILEINSIKRNEAEKSGISERERKKERKKDTHKTDKKRKRGRKK